MGIPWVRTFIWQISMLGLIGVGAELLVYFAGVAGTVMILLQAV